MNVRIWKILYSFLVSIFLITPLLQAAPATLWEKTFGGTVYDKGNFVQQTSDGGYIVTGSTQSYGSGGNDVYLIKTDANGIQQWQKTFGGSDFDEGYSVQQTSDDGYFIVGVTRSYGSGLDDVYIIKTDPNGNQQWDNTFGWSKRDKGYSGQQTSDGGYIITGYNSLIPGRAEDIYLIKTDPNGDSLWERFLGGTGSDIGNLVQQTSDGGYIIVGHTDSFGSGDLDVYLIKTDSIGTLQWEKTFGGTDYDVGKFVQETSDGGYIITGGTQSYGFGDNDVYLIKTDANGIQQWDKTFGGNQSDYGYSVQQTLDGGYIIGGYTQSYGAGSRDAYLIKVDSHGNQQWQKTFGGSVDDTANFVQQTSEGGYIVSGATSSFGAGSSDMWLIRMEAGHVISGYVHTCGGLGIEGVVVTAENEATIDLTDVNGYYELTIPNGWSGEVSLVPPFSSPPNKLYNNITENKINENFAVIQADNITFGGSDDDAGSSVERTSDSGYIITGHTKSYGLGMEDVYLVKTDSSGTQQWEKTFGGSQTDRGYSVQQTSDGGYIIGGYTKSYGAVSYDVYLIKTNSEGDLQWEETFGGDWTDHGYSVQQTSDGGYVITGYTQSYGAGLHDVYLIKTNSNGSQQWQKTFGGITNDIGQCIQQTSDGGYIIVGLTDSYGLGIHDVYLIKTNSIGILQWQKTFGGANDDIGNSVQQTSDGGYIITGDTQSFGSGGRDVYLIKTDANGIQQWDKTFGGSNDDVGWALQQTSDGGYFVAGFTESYGAGNKDVYLIKTDQSGNEQWSKTFGGSNDDYGRSFQLTPEGEYVIVGYTDSYGAGAQDMLFIYISPPLWGDFEPDCDVDFSDFSILALSWLSQDGHENWNPYCNISKPVDIIIDQHDLQIFAENWLESRN